MFLTLVSVGAPPNEHALLRSDSIRVVKVTGVEPRPVR